MYTKKLLEHFRNPKYAGELKDANAHGKVGNISCGDIMELFLKIEDDKIVDVRFKTYGCAAAIASTDILCELIKGMTLEEARKVTKNDVLKQLGELPPIKVHCSVLATEALDDALKNYSKAQ